jgi:hypothetical protein
MIMPRWLCQSAVPLYINVSDPAKPQGTEVPQMAKANRKPIFLI